MIPAFETGRLAGLARTHQGARSSGVGLGADYPNQPEPQNFPYFLPLALPHRRSRRLPLSGQPAQAAACRQSVGMRDFDVSDPGSNIPPIVKPGLNGILRLGGALQVPDADLSDDDQAERQVRELGPALSRRVRGGARQVHQPAGRLRSRTLRPPPTPPLRSGPTSSDDPDPLITSPLYGRWHALTQRLLTQARRHGRAESDELGASAQSRSTLPRAGQLRH